MKELGRLERYDKELSKITKSVVQFNPKLSVVSNWSDRSESAIKVPAVVTWLYHGNAMRFVFEEFFR